MLYTCAEHLYDIYMTYLVKYSTRVVHPVMKIRKYMYKKNFLASHSSFMYLSFLLYISLFFIFNRLLKNSHHCHHQSDLNVPYENPNFSPMLTRVQY